MTAVWLWLSLNQVFAGPIKAHTDPITEIKLGGFSIESERLSQDTPSNPALSLMSDVVPLLKHRAGLKLLSLEAQVFGFVSRW